jgi:AcrR family transcriptional regulator
MGSSERRARAKVALRQQILDAARDLFVREGYDAVSMRRIAARIEYSPTAIYLHFPDKQSILTALCDETFEKLSMRLATLFARTTDPLTRLKDGLHLYVEFGLAHPHHYTVSFLVKPRDVRTSEPTAGHRAFAFLQAAVAEAMASGAIRPGEVETTSQTLWAACHGIVALLITVPEDRFAFVPAERLARHMIDTLIAGLQVSAAVPARTRPAIDAAPSKAAPSKAAPSKAVPPRRRAARATAVPRRSRR